MVKSMSSMPCVVCSGPVEVTRPYFRIRRIEPHRLRARFQKFALRPSHWECYESWHERWQIAEDVVKCFTDDFAYTESKILWSNKPVALAISAEGLDPDCALLAFSAT